MDIRGWEKAQQFRNVFGAGACIQACPVHALKRDPLIFSKGPPVCSNVKKKEEDRGWTFRTQSGNLRNIWIIMTEMMIKYV